MTSYTLDLDRRTVVMVDLLDRPPRSSSEEYLISMAHTLAKKCQSEERDDLSDTILEKISFVEDRARNAERQTDIPCPKIEDA